jgi:carboxyl-terminal processing protease
MGKGEDYSQDLTHRYESGELFNVDSIKFDKSKVYKTDGGRVVYGGGGITPDIFVAKDTLMNSKYLFELYSKNIIREYALRYANENQKKLEKQPFKEYLKSFQVSDAMLAELVKDASRAGIKPNEKELNLSKPLITSQTKAIIGRYVWGRKQKSGLNNEVFQVLNPSDNVYQQAVQLFTQAAQLEKGEFSSMNIPKNKK